MTASSESWDIVGSLGVVTGHSLDFSRFRNSSSPRRNSEATDGTLRPIRSAICGSVQPWQCFEHNHLAHQLGQFRQGLDHSQQLLVPLGPTAGRGLVGGQPGGEPRGGTVQVGLQRPLQGDVPLVPLVVLDRIGQRPGQDPPQPGDQHLGPGVAQLPPAPNRPAASSAGPRRRGRAYHEASGRGAAPPAPSGTCGTAPGFPSRLESWAIVISLSSQEDDVSDR